MDSSALALIAPLPSALADNHEQSSDLACTQYDTSHRSQTPTRYPYACSHQPSAHNVDELRCSQRVRPTLYLVFVTMLCVSSTAASYAQVGERTRSHANATGWLVGWYWSSVVYTQSVYLNEYICANVGSRAATNIITTHYYYQPYFKFNYLSTWPRRCAL